MSCKDVLIVEDDTDIRESFAMLLEDEGFKVFQAENGLIALNILRSKMEETPGCIILDWTMPVMDGPTFLETLKREHPDDLCNIPIILATAKGSAKDDVSHLPCLSERISKPVDVDELIQTVQKYCGVLS